MCKMAFILQNYLHIHPYFPEALKDTVTNKAKVMKSEINPRVIQIYYHIAGNLLLCYSPSTQNSGTKFLMCSMTQP